MSRISAVRYGRGDPVFTATSDGDLELTILMPCLDEAATVGRCVGKALGYLARAGIRGEALVADNGSSDGSRDLAATAGARVIAVARKGYAMGVGLQLMLSGVLSAMIDPPRAGPAD